MKQVLAEDSHDSGSPAPPAGTRRVFLAIPLPDATRLAVADLVGRLQKAAHFTPLRANWVPLENMHLTLHFLGSVAQPQIDALLRDLPAATARVRRFSAEAAGIGYFPHSGAPTVLWAGVTRPLRALHQLRDALGQIVVAQGVPLQHQEFHAHITLARFKSLKGTGAFVNMARSYQTHPLGSFMVESAHLMESIFDKERGGVRYGSLGAAPLEV